MQFLSDFILSFRSLNIYLKLFFVASFIIGSWARYQNLFNLGYYFDMVETQFTWGRGAFTDGVFGFWQNYPMAKHYDYPPISLIYEYFVYALAKVFSGDITQNFVTILKSVNWLFDLILTLFIVAFGNFLRDHKLTSKNSLNPQSLGWILAGFFYAIPSSWFVSGVWGQNDTLMILITLVCLFILVAQGFFENWKLPFLDQIKNSHNLFSNPYFWSGFILAIGFWIKQQPILLLPILGLIFMNKKGEHGIPKNKDVFTAIAWVLPIILSFAVLGLFYTEIPIQFSNPFNSFTTNFGFNYPVISSWGILANLGTLLVFIIPFTILVYFQFWDLKKEQIGSKTSTWFELRKFLLGFWLVSTIIAIPFVISNYQRFARVTLAAVIRGDSIANGATTFWGIFVHLKSANDLVLGFGGKGLSVRNAALIIYLVLVGFLLFRYLNLDFKKLKTWDLSVIFAHKLNLFQLLAIMWVHTTSYFLFFPNMHSRYLHFGVIYSLFVTFFIPLKKPLIASLWIVGLLILNIFYALNGFLVFGVNNDSPIWVRNFIELFTTGGRNIDAWWLSSVGIFVSFVIMYTALILADIWDKKSPVQN